MKINSAKTCLGLAFGDLLFFLFRPDNVKDEAETYWLSVLESGLDASSSEVKVEVKKEKPESFTTNDPHEITKQENQDQSYENVDEDSQMGK